MIAVNGIEEAVERILHIHQLVTAEADKRVSRHLPAG